jgi:16S rRNA processing protein RimM
MAKTTAPNSDDKAPRSKGKYYTHRNQRVFVPDGYVAVGRITSAHGLKGEIKVEMLTDFPEERFAPGQQLAMGRELKPVTITGQRQHGGGILLLLAQLHDRTAAEALRDEWLYVPEDATAELPADTYWIHEIVGLHVKTEEGVLLGAITEVLPTGANDVYEVQPAAGEPFLIPAIAEVVRSVDLLTGVMVVRLPEGLLDSAPADE